jgi:hypothetical protein
MNNFGGHIPIRSLIDFMLNQYPLTGPEQEHLAKCEKCLAEMIEAISIELKTQSSTAATSLKDSADA